MGLIMLVMEFFWIYCMNTTYYYINILCEMTPLELTGVFSGAKENEVKFRIPNRPIPLCYWLTLREELRRVVGYYDCDAVLDDFIELVGEAFKSENPKEKLHDLVTGYFLKEKDSRIKVAMRFPDSLSESLRRRYPVTVGVRYTREGLPLQIRGREGL